MAKQKIKRDHIVLGKPLTFSIYDGDGKLLITEGSVIRSVFQLNTLLERGIYFLGPGAPQKNDETAQASVKSYPFEIIDEVYSDLKNILWRSDADTRLPAKILKLCVKLQKASEDDHDACLGVLCLEENYQYPVMHSIHAALVCKTILKHLGWHPEQRLVAMAAALTMNIAMTELQETLHSQKGPLTDEQKLEIMSHPERSADVLEKCGVRDEVWLNSVVQHHEMLDGSGYPYSRREKDIFQPARVLTLADIYSAKISGRAYRKPILATSALRELFLHTKKGLDPDMSKILIKNLGLFPPGSFVELSNGEIAVVTRVGDDARRPIVSSVVRSDGRVFGKPVVRLTSEEQYGIKKILSKKEARVEINRLQLWGYI